jgi:ElaB/YqjD/DUF883 family membrane-anchored ribosome-binding protein
MSVSSQTEEILACAASKDQIQFWHVNLDESLQLKEFGSVPGARPLLYSCSTNAQLLSEQVAPSLPNTTEGQPGSEVSGGPTNEQAQAQGPTVFNHDQLLAAVGPCRVHCMVLETRLAELRQARAMWANADTDYSSAVLVLHRLSQTQHQLQLLPDMLPLLLAKPNLLSLPVLDLLLPQVHELLLSSHQHQVRAGLLAVGPLLKTIANELERVDRSSPDACTKEAREMCQRIQQSLTHIQDRSNALATPATAESAFPAFISQTAKSTSRLIDLHKTLLFV